ncbi:MAG: helicase-exonuclease AddAB subunit AddA [Clostridia bacterium]|nr:helicase-exonuclease AddAB subunit AddA [Clostridia bacterium]
MDWTKEQKDAISKKNSNILVAAAAGSGKTAVLVERIIKKIAEDGLDIDKLLVVTFTSAAASQMRERVLEAIYKKIEEQPENEKLQKQLILLGKSNICTIHSFCLDIIRNNFYEIDLSSNFRIGTEEETELLKQEVLDDIFEELYESENEDFVKLIDTYTSYRGDDSLKELILKIYRFSQSTPFPEEWLEKSVQKFKKTDEIKDFSITDWGKILLQEIEEEIIDAIQSLKVYKNKCEKYIELEKFTACLSKDIENLVLFKETVKESWDKSYEFYCNFSFGRWPTDKKVTLALKEESKIARDMVKKKINDVASKILLYDSREAYEDIYAMHEVLSSLKEVIFKFSKVYTERKKEKNIIDFNDIEHYALKILIKKNENGLYIPTEVAKKYQEKFVEIAIDEYQDSNLVQELILNTVSRGNNIFMVGDIKQSIYKFRQACPELFLEKYNLYSLDGNEKGIKIKLFKNFRSRENVLNFTNNIFENIMSSELGDIDYNKEEFLNFGADFDENINDLGKTEIHIIELEDSEKENEISFQNEVTDDGDIIEKQELEARFIANKIDEYISKKIKVKDKKEGYRPVKYRDIVILLRATSGVAPIFEKELLSRNIPVFSDATSEYLDTIEIQTIICLLKILDNPVDDISLVSVLRSQIGKFTDNDLVQIRLVNKNVKFYYSIKEAKEKLCGEIKIKIEKFLNKLDDWRKKSEYMNLAELIWEIYSDTGFYEYCGLMPNGTLRQANLKMLFERAKEYEKTSFKGLFNFIRFIEKFKAGNGDMSAAKIIGENENVVRIMSIHKSKGLEFPIVFLANSSKKANFMDLSDNILLHQNLGLGPEYINYERRIKYSTSAKQAIRVASKKEVLSEEMRVLYVALTRAKEKLIITSTDHNVKKKLEKKKELYNIYNSDDNKINPILVKKFSSYLDWIELVSFSKDSEKLIKINIHNKNEIKKSIIENEEESPKFNFSKDVDIEKISDLFNFKYKHSLETELPSKSTVSKIKEMAIEKSNLTISPLLNKEVGLLKVVPKFLENKDNKISRSRIGTITHLILQKIDYKNEYDLNKIKELIEEMISKSIITREEANSIQITKILEFLKTDFAKKIKNSKLIQKEKPFCTKILAKEIFENAKDETVLVQGIIDLYFIDEENNLILVDYKTDFVEPGYEDELIIKYKKQLEIYKKALEEGTQKKVYKTYIYSIYLNKELEV